MSKLIIIGIPAYGNAVKLATLRSLVYDTAKLLTNGWDIEILDTVSGAEIDTIRNKMVSYLASHGSADELIMVDDDVCWNDGDLLRLLAADIDTDRDIVGGVYPKRADPIEYPFNPLVTDSGEMRVDPDNHLIMCRHIPAGFMRIPKGTAQHLIEEHENMRYAAVFNTVEPKNYPVYSLFEKMWDTSEMTGEKHRASEDVSFCRRVLEAGGSVYAHPDIAMGHVGNKLYLGSKLRGHSARHYNEST